MKKLLMVLLVLFGLVFASSGLEISAASKVKMSESEITLEVGKTKKLKLKGAKNVKWKSNDKTIATVTKKGKVKAKKAGTCIVYATSDDGLDYCIVNVTEPKKKVKAVKIHKEYAGVYKMTSMNSDDMDIKKGYFDIFEKHGIFMATMELTENGHAKLVFNSGNESVAEYTITDKYFVDDETGRKLVYVFKDGEVTLFEQSILSTVDSTFVKMTDSEIAIWKKGYSEEELQKAAEEVTEYLKNDQEYQDSVYKSYIEKSRRASDDLDYSGFVDASQLAVLDQDVSKELEKGHSYSIVITKEGLSVLKDGKKVDQNDPFYKCLVKYTSDYTVETSKVRSSFAEKYVIDVTSDGTVKRTQAPEKDY